MNRLLIIGGAGFVGSNLAVSLASRHPDWEILVPQPGVGLEETSLRYRRRP